MFTQTFNQSIPKCGVELTSLQRMEGYVTTVYITAQDERKHYIISPPPHINLEASLLSFFIIVLIEYTVLSELVSNALCHNHSLLLYICTITSCTGLLLRKAASALFQSGPPFIRPYYDLVVLSQQYLVS